MPPSHPLVSYRAVHLDLKGLPPTSGRLLSLLDLFAALRYNAVLVEWEDMFPWTLDPRFRCETAYTPDDIARFAAKAKSLGLELIPLVQCLGHMETFLRPPEYAPLREVPDQCDVLNPLAPGATQFVQRLIDDVLALLPQVNYFHLGGDEAWTFGSHPDTKAYIAEKGKGALYMHHVQPLLDALAARSIRPILWHDMMIDWDDAALAALSRSADLCVWGYGQTPDETAHHYATRHIQRFADAGVTMWGGGAYKGADGSNVDLPNLAARRHNALGWADIARRFSLRGLIATAWSRYNTNLQQCEPIDTALDALALVAAIFHDGAAPTPANVSSLSQACDAALEAAGELASFRQRKSILERFTRTRRHAWTTVQDTRECLALARKDPRRTGTAQALKRLETLRLQIQQLNDLGAEFKQAMTGAVDPLWIDRYLSERIDPLQDELADLQRGT
jgi:hexosaminidase